MKKYKAVIWKEIKECLRVAKVYIFLTAVFAILLQIFSVKSIAGDVRLASSDQGLLISFSLIFLPLLCIPFLGNIILTRTLYEERKENATQVLLATGIDPKILWFGKMTVVFIFSYSGFLLSALLYYLVYLIIFDFPIAINAEIFLTGFIVAPFFSFGFLSILGFLFWALKNPQWPGIILPIAFVFGAWNIGSLWGQVVPDSLFVLGAFIIGVLLFLLSGLAVNFLTKEKITDC